MSTELRLNDTAFGPEEVAMIDAAFEGACKSLGLVIRSDPIVEAVAKAIFHAAENGGGDAAEIQQRALTGIKLMDSEQGNQRPLHSAWHKVA